VELTREFFLVHEHHERSGRLDHAFGERDEADFFPLLKWDGQAFVELPSVPITH
jgi:hypothetical protein